MKAAIFSEIGRLLSVESVPDPSPAVGEVLLKVDRCGICGSDLHMTEDPFFCLPSGSILGHEYSGTVIALGLGVERLRLGDRVSVLPIASCGTCAACQVGLPSHCPEMTIMGGGYAEMSVVHERQCVRLPSTVSAEDGALVEPLAVGLHGLNAAAMPQAAKVLVIGAGPIGLATAFWARRRGATRVAVMASSDVRKDLALKIGATDFFISQPESVDVVKEKLGGAPDVVFECVGKPGLIEQCIEHVRPRGTVVVLGLCSGVDQFSPFSALKKEVTIKMSPYYNLHEFEVSVDVLDSGSADVAAMITDRVDLASLPAAFEALRNRTTQCKVMVTL